MGDTKTSASIYTANYCQGSAMQVKGPQDELTTGSIARERKFAPDAVYIYCTVQVLWNTEKTVY